MSGPRRLILSLLLGAAATGAAAQNVVAPPPPSRPDTVGPEQLRDFSLGGNRDGQDGQPAATAPSRPAPAATTALPPPTREAPPSTPARTIARPAEPTPARPAAPQARPAESVTVDLPGPGAASTTSQPAPPSSLPSFGFPSSPTPAPVTTLPAPLPNMPAGSTVSDEDGGWTATLLPLLAVLAALGGGVLWWLRRSRAEPEQESFGQLAFAGGPSPEPRAAPVPRPAPSPPPPASPPTPKPASVGVVSTRLRAWLDLEVAVRMAAMTDTELQLDIDILLTNSGSAPAREIAVEALLLNAGPEQEAELARFFARPEAAQQAPDVVPAMGQLALSARLTMPRTSFREYAVGSAKVMVPIVALSAGYKAGAGRGRTSAAFLVGRGEVGAEKLAPLPTDGGAKGFARLAARLLPGVERR